MHQNFPLAPYFFLLVAEALNMAIKEEQRRGRIMGIWLPDNDLHQFISQFADNMGFSILGQEEVLRNIVAFIQRFGLASGLQVNWIKSVRYWFVQIPRPTWTNQFGLTWAWAVSLSTLLGAPFGITFDTLNIDTFFQHKIGKKLSYWSTQRLSLASKATIVNAVLLSTLYYFISIWCGSL